MKLDVFDYVGMFAGLLMVLALVILFLRFVKSVILSIARSKSMEKRGGSDRQRELDKTIIDDL